MSADFWSRVLFSFGEGCWEWQGPRKPGSYGAVRLDGKMVGAHRAAWILTNGPIERRQYVCHRCDNPICVRPDHLFIGSQRDNMRDASAKGRLHGGGARGEQIASSKLSAKDVLRIRSAVEGGKRMASVARDFGIDRAHVRRIVRHEAWKHLPAPAEAAAE